jgi:nicotinic acid mononucleotide adenylyltransferase
LELYEKKRQYVFVREDGAVSEKIDKKLLILSGSFNPLHHGHVSLLKTAAKHLPNRFPCLELSAFNADKPPIDMDRVLERVVQAEGVFPMIVTNAPTFIEKARLLPDSVFVVGIDTANRIVQNKYYSNSDDKMNAALEEFKRLGCQFLVAGRLVDGKFSPPSDMKVPLQTKDLFLELPEFRVDISSTELRAKGTLKPDL